jgi:hypothetical protein
MMQTPSRRFACVLSVILPAGLFARAADGAVTIESMLDEMTNLKSLAEFPDPPFTCRQFSSYDRRSTDPNIKTTENWFANGDAGHYLRVEQRDGRQEHVMMDAAGPGAIVRIWSANPKGTLRIYLDGDETPALEASMPDLLAGKVPGFPKPITGVQSRGWNSYMPIPYAKHCKVTSDEAGFYYHVNYRTYPEGTQVRTFTRQQLDDLKRKIVETADRLNSPRLGCGPPATRDKQGFEVSLKPGERKVVAELDGPRAICGFLANLRAGDRDRALRQTVVCMTFDGETTVETPLGDFFGTAPGINPYASLPMGMTMDGDMWSHWYMPFRDSARVELENLGRQDVTVGGGVSSAPYEWTDRTMHFHAGWRIEFDKKTRPISDWNYVTVDGKGVFTGAAFNIANPKRGWWGEGDEKIYVDGEDFPSHFGTGTEDYYGYAWCCNEPFVHAYHNQPRCDGPGNYGCTSVNRWHILDKIPFTDRFKFDMEMWHSQDTQVTPAVTCYWYAMPGAKDTYEPLTPAMLEYRPMKPFEPYRVPGAIEGEKMEVIEKTGNVTPQGFPDCSNDEHMWWAGGQKPGDKLTLAFSVDRARRYKVIARCLKAPDYAVAQIYINGVKAGDPVDFYRPSAKATGEVTLGEFDLKQGRNTITFEITGANPKAQKKYMTGLDYLRLEPIK